MILSDLNRLEISFKNQPNMQWKKSRMKTKGLLRRLEAATGRSEFRHIAELKIACVKLILEEPTKRWLSDANDHLIQTMSNLSMVFLMSWDGRARSNATLKNGTNVLRENVVKISRKTPLQELDEKSTDEAIGEFLDQTIASWLELLLQEREMVRSRLQKGRAKVKAQLRRQREVSQGNEEE